MSIQLLEESYINAAFELRSKQSNLKNYQEELNVFLTIRDSLTSQVDFSGYLPETYFSGGDLDPIGLAS